MKNKMLSISVSGILTFLVCLFFAFMFWLFVNIDFHAVSAYGIIPRLEAGYCDVLS